MSVITLTSDIGLQDYLVAATKGQLLQTCPDARVMDISHRISPFNLPQAVYIFKSAFEYYPAGTFHIVLINLFDKKHDHMLIARYKDQYICTADNGFITMIAGNQAQEIIRMPLDPALSKTTLNVTAAFAETISKMCNGAHLSELGEKADDIIVKNNLQPLTGDDYIEGQIIHIDNFENVIVNITREQFEAQRKNRRFGIMFRRNETINAISETYSDVPEGQKVAMFNSAGYLEIAINKGNAAGLFGLQGFSREQLVQNATAYQQLAYYQTVRIAFEE
ncbi:SAM-dependent chlorinase/fluorinase [Chitinophaga sedimenti]|uniref:SAM hydrolase/SAM-dependent halogenase family protein n=1 Tax=Chitinophaga sedimenti TaxID=2033606 RepID=UPI002004D05F|nr:SAM-dependent chlorinase/fluorinase [Chitinophaga sedimenti]MCK7555609.1 SAM-dependent chlorinase/fluorinase [Chitinophaga sedimenti]